MKFFYIANIRIPTEKAHGIQIMEMCNAFSAQGVSVELVVPRRFNDIKEDPFSFYGVKESFVIKKLPCVDLVRFGKVGYFLELLSFSFSVKLYVFLKKGTFYTRDEFLALVLRIIGKKVFWEEHRGNINFFIKILAKMGIKFVVITKALKSLYVSRGIRKESILVAPDGVDVARFTIDLEKESARKELGLPLDKKIILYKGHLYPWKGVDTLAEASSFLNDGSLIVFIGGTEEDVASFKKRFGDRKNISILGHRPRKETPVYQKASDVVVIPNSSKEDISNLYTSPIKLFSYMASERPLVASDLPSLREVLREENAFFAKADNPQSFAKVIRYALDNPKEAQKKALQARSDVENYTWGARAKNIINFIENV